MIKLKKHSLTNSYRINTHITNGPVKNTLLTPSKLSLYTVSQPRFSPQRYASLNNILRSSVLSVLGPRIHTKEKPT